MSSLQKTVKTGLKLFGRFIHDTLEEETSLDTIKNILAANDMGSSFIREIKAPSRGDPEIEKYARKLKAAADSYAESRERSSRKEVAKELDLRNLSQEGVYALLQSFFENHRVAIERIVASLMFCCDVALFAYKLQQFGVTAVDVIIFLKRAESFYKTIVLPAVEDAGGWDAVMAWVKENPFLVMTSAALVVGGIALISSILGARERRTQK